MYCFVVRGILGMPVFTQDGQKSIPAGHAVFANSEQRELADIPGSNAATPYHSLIAEVGGKILRHRELLIFDGDRTACTHLIAYVRG